MKNSRSSPAIFRSFAYKGAQCYICRNLELREAMFSQGIKAFHINGRLYFRNEATFKNPRYRAHEYKHFQQWRADPQFDFGYLEDLKTNGYRNSRYEREAREAAAQACN